MVFYTNYKQVAKLTLRSGDAVRDSLGSRGVPIGKTQGALETNDIIHKYTFNVNLPFMQFNKNTRLAVDTFGIRYPKRPNEETHRLLYPSDVYIKNIHRKEVYDSSSKSSNGTCILSYPFVPERPDARGFMYQNNDLINNSIDITGSTAFLQGQPLEIFIDTKATKWHPTTMAEDGVVNGCPHTYNWTLSLIVYEEEKEENQKDYVDDRAKNFGIPKLY